MRFGAFQIKTLFRARLPFLLLVAALVAINWADARVFMRFRRSANVVDAEQMGWSNVFSGQFVVDGVATNAQVLASRSSAAATLRRLESVYRSRDSRFAGFSGREMAWGVAERNGEHTRVLIVAPLAMNSTIVFLFHEQGGARGTVSRTMPADIPGFPGARITRTVARRDTGLEGAFLETTATPGEVISFYERALSAAGWTPLISDRTGRSVQGSLLLFGKGNRISCISVNSSGGGARNLITVLVKDGGI